MEVSREKKVSLRHIYMEIGRRCNLKCRHCCKGESEDKEMSDEVMDALLDNVHFIDEITVTGGEPMLYIERMRKFLDKCRERKIRVNYFNVITNCTFRSEAFVQLLNDWIDYCTFGNENEFIYSTDKYHKEYLAEYMPHVDIEANAEWYRKCLKECKFIDNGTSKDLDYNIFIFNEGRVRKWTEKELDKIFFVKEVSRCRTRTSILLRPECKGEENLCKYGCVYNCVKDQLYIGVDGKVFLDTFTSFELQDNCNEICLGNICDELIFDIVTRCNERAENAETSVFQPYLKNNFSRLVDYVKLEGYMADRYCCLGVWDMAEKKYHKYYRMLQHIIKERNELVDWFNTISELYQLDKESPLTLGEQKEILKTMKEETPEIHELYIKVLKDITDTEKAMSDSIQQANEMRRTLDVRKEKNLSGSIFVNPYNRRAVMEDLEYKMNVLNKQLAGNAEENVLGNMFKGLLDIGI